MQASNTQGLLHGSDWLVVTDPVKETWEKANINAGPRGTIRQQFTENHLGFEDEEVFECGPILSHSSAEDVTRITGCPPVSGLQQLETHVPTLIMAVSSITTTP